MLRLEGKTIQIITTNILNNNMVEIWKSVLDYEGLYEVSNFGRVRSLEYKGKKRKEPLILSGGDNGTGYLQVILCKNSIYKHLYIHRLVVEAFIGRIPKGYEINHIDENKKNNCLSNLEIVTRKQNMNHGTRNMRAGKSISKQLDLLEVQYPHRELTFTNSCECSKFFNYKRETQIGSYISAARKKGSNIIKIKGIDYFYTQQKKGVANV